jgi:hypothetical protein
MADYKECKFYTRQGKCSHEEAKSPAPYESSCIGRESCAACEDSIGHMAIKRDATGPRLGIHPNDWYLLLQDIEQTIPELYRPVVGLLEKHSTRYL